MYHNEFNKWAESIKRNKNFGKWNYYPKDSNKSVPVGQPPTTDSIIEEIRQHPGLEDRGFFDDVVSWLREDAPKKLRGFLHDLYPHTTGLSKASADLSYKTLCGAVYKAEFRASERLEQRMMLGSSNEWVRKYFADFPPRRK